MGSKVRNKYFGGTGLFSGRVCVQATVYSRSFNGFYNLATLKAIGCAPSIVSTLVAILFAFSRPPTKCR